MEWAVGKRGAGSKQSGPGRTEVYSESICGIRLVSDHKCVFYFE